MLCSRKLYKSIFLILLVIITFSCKSKQQATYDYSYYSELIQDSTQADSIKKEIFNKNQYTEKNIRLLSKYYIRSGNYSELFRYFKPVFEKAMITHEYDVSTYSGAFLATAYLELDKIDSMAYYINRILKYTDNNNPNDIYYTGLIHNLSAINAIRYNMNYTEALKHYQIAREAMEKLRDSTNLSVVLINIAGIFSMRQDTSGFLYARKAYDLSKSSDNNILKIRTSILMGNQHFLLEDIDSALFYLNMAVDYINRYDIERNSKIQVNMLLGKIYHYNNQNIKAEQCFIEAISEMRNREDLNGFDIQTYIAYGDLKMDMKDYGQAINLYKAGLSISQSNKNNENTYILLEKLSKAYELLNNPIH